METHTPNEGTIPDIIATARNNPIHPGLAPPSMDTFLTVFGDGHTLLFMVEWAISEQAWEYHFSLAKERGKFEPSVGLSTGLLMGFMAALGVPKAFAMSDNVVHIHWTKEEEHEAEQPSRPH